MFPILYNYIDTTALQQLMEKQNKLLSYIADNISPSLDYCELIATVILGLITLWIAKQQTTIMKKQHNLDLFNKRWALYEELKVLAKQSYTQKQDFSADGIKNYNAFYSQLKTLSQQLSIIFDPEISNKCDKLANNYQEMYQLQKELKTNDSRLTICNNKSNQEKEVEIITNMGSLSAKILTTWEDIQRSMLANIKKSDIV